MELVGTERLLSCVANRTRCYRLFTESLPEFDPWQCEDFDHPHRRNLAGEQEIFSLNAEVDNLFNPLVVVASEFPPRRFDESRFW